MQSVTCFYENTRIRHIRVVDDIISISLEEECFLRECQTMLTFDAHSPNAAP